MVDVDNWMAGVGIIYRDVADVATSETSCDRFKMFSNVNVLNWFNKLY